ncbi:MAG TPA: AbrB family transcriptional regulator [Acidobacteria bacterium]|nr:AbrB family transcriptional regulator [Acidobacteriota bacterium]
MSRMTTTLDGDGRLVLPAEVRSSLGLEAGDRVVFVLDEKGVHLRPSRTEAVRRAQALVRQYIPEGVSLADELMEERRREALLE